MRFHIAYLSLMHGYRVPTLATFFIIEAHIEACEDQYEENAVKLVSSVKRQMGFD
jgi:hypothetical protein